jgi:PAS domain S-box-containing protein
VRKSEEYYHMIMENAGDAILVLDVESRKIVDNNQRASVLTGMAYEEILRRGSIPSREIEGRDRSSRKA